MEKEVFIHVGMMKTGTTYLQKNIFPNLEDVYFIDENAFSNYKQSFQYGANIDVKTLNYYKLINKYVEEFGKENILILPLERLKSREESFLNELTLFLGTKVDIKKETKTKNSNKSYSLISAYLALFLNRFLINGRNGFGFIPNQPFYMYFSKKSEKSFFFKVLREISFRISLRFFLQNIVDKIFYKKAQFINHDIRKRIMDYHSEANRLLDKEFDLNLKDYGYYS